MKAIRYQKDAVLIKKGKIEAWVEVYIKNKDVHTEWHKYIFFLDNEKDVILRDWQDNVDNFLDATCLAVNTLEEFGIIAQDENAKWYQTEKYHTTEGTMIIEQKKYSKKNLKKITIL